VNDGKQTHIGTPYLDAATVDATVTAVGKGDKVIVFKFKAKKDYRRKQGHRQPFTEIEIERVSLDGKTVMKKEAPKKVEKPAPKKDDEEKPEGNAEDKEKADAAIGEKNSDTDEKQKDAKAKDLKAEKEESPAKDENAEEPKITADEETKPDAPESKADEENTPEELKAKVEEEPKSADAPKLKKADIIAKLDELGAEYNKNAKKDELLAILAEAEKS
jgi:large subunit ribosomal protein L21